MGAMCTLGRSPKWPHPTEAALAWQAERARLARLGPLFGLRGVWGGRGWGRGA